MSNKYRIALERAITVALVEECAKAGFVPVCVWDGGCYEPQGGEDSNEGPTIHRVITPAEVLEYVFSVDESTIHFGRAEDPAGTWGALGVFVVGGNGEDFISDYHCGDASFAAAVERASDRVEKLEVTLGV